MTYQPLQFDAAPRPYRLGNDQLRRYNRVRAGQRAQGRVNIAIDVVTILLIVSVSAIVAIVELSSMRSSPRSSSRPVAGTANGTATKTSSSSPSPTQPCTPPGKTAPS